jgi:hypothetical protein
MEFTTIGNAKKQTGLAYLGGINISAKLSKNQKVSDVMTYCIYLSPANTSGYNVCAHSTPECRLGCLATSGRAGMELHTENIRTIQNARIKKTKLFHEENEFFMNWLVAELRSYQNKAAKLGIPFSVRLNGTSDINWSKYPINGKTVFELFPDVQFYDYTKEMTKLFDVIPNYHLTLSYAGYKDELFKMMLSKGNNVAVVFNVHKVEELPATFLGFPVINGDATDYRPNDEKGSVVGLKWKSISNKATEKAILNSVFVVNPNDERCTY